MASKSYANYDIDKSVLENPIPYLASKELKYSIIAITYATSAFNPPTKHRSFLSTEQIIYIEILRPLQLENTSAFWR